MLIHSATGGVGQAAIAIARAAGAEIFATAGSERAPSNCCATWASSMSTTRAASSSPSGSAATPTGTASTSCSTRLPAPPSALASNCWRFGGRFVEIGKRDIYGDTRLGLFPFRRNLSFYAVDLGLLAYSHPEPVRDLLDTVYQLTADGALPVPQSTHYPLADAATAIRLMGGAEHTGKLVLDVPHTGRQPRGGAAGAGSGLPRATAPTSSPAAWAASGCSWPRRWPRPAAGASC